MKNAFLDPTTRVLKCVGYVSLNEVGDIVLPVPDDFSWQPRKCRHDGTTWVSYVPPPTQEEQDRTTAKADAVVQYLRTHTPAECAVYVQQNVTDLPSAKALLEKFAMVLSVLSRNL